ALLVITTSLLNARDSNHEAELQEEVRADVSAEPLSAVVNERAEQPSAALPAGDVAPATFDVQPDAEQTQVPPEPMITSANGNSDITLEVPAEPAAHLVLIIDDIGYNAEAGQRAINLPGQVTYAVIPYTPHGKTLAESAHQANKEVMLHAPMSNLSGMDLGQGGLTLLLKRRRIPANTAIRAG
ncbi:MAG: divergent polysaccharide deacetylase family protein, partial [Gammaproteobacteria bacterium]|nr:divergent polysaccharide deacetylase family protein [Gammaproteobacteria bacterium]